MVDAEDLKSSNPLKGCESSSLSPGMLKKFNSCRIIETAHSSAGRADAS